MAKLLLSRLVILDAKEVNITLKSLKIIARKRKELDSIDFKTPRRSQQVRSIVNSFKVKSPKTRLLLRKVGKHIDNQNIIIAESEAKIRNLQHQVDSLRLKKKQKVEENPNSRFIRIEEIIKTKRKIEQELQQAKASNKVEVIESRDLYYVSQLGKKK